MNLLNLFTQARKDRVTTIETSIYAKDTLTLPWFSGMHTVKNVNPHTSDDLFYFRPGQNLIEGYVEVSDAKSLNLINGRKKLVRSICYSFYHAIMDDMSEILNALNKYPDHDLVIDISDISRGLNSGVADWDFFNFFVETLRENGTEVQLVELKNYDVIYLDNFRLVNFIYESGQKANLIHELFKKKVDNPDIKPTKNVFVSRGLLPSREVHEEAEGLSFKEDNRMQDHKALEDYFAGLGYDIIHAEKFSSFPQQLNYFYSAKNIVSLTGSGLTNAVFMQPGGSMFEIVTPLVVTVPPPDGPKDITNPFYVQEIHNFYKNLAYYQNHTFACVQNPNRNFDEFKAKIEGNPKLKAYLDCND
jgi:hypothetical protein